MASEITLEARLRKIRAVNKEDYGGDTTKSMKAWFEANKAFNADFRARYGGEKHVVHGICCSDDYLSMVTMLMQYSDDWKTTTTSGGFTALDIAKDNGCKKLIKLLKSRGAK